MSLIQIVFSIPRGIIIKLINLTCIGVFMKRKYARCFLLLLSILYSGYSFSFEVGVGTHISGFTGTPEQYINLLKKYNITSFRTDYHWADVEKQRGVYTPASHKLDALINLAVINNIKPILILDYGNPLYVNGKPTTDNERDAFARYAAWTVSHFKGKVDVFEIWNEWHLEKPRFLSQNQKSAQQYVSLVHSCYTAIKKVDPNVKVIAGSFNPTQKDEIIWQDKLFELGFLNYIDGVSIHTYHNTDSTFMPPQDNLSLIDAMQEKIIKIKGAVLPVYITEIGISDYYKNKIPQADIGKFASEYFMFSAKRNYIQGVWWYDFINDGIDKKNGEHNFGMLNRDLSEKDTASAIKQFSQRLRVK